MNLHLKSLTAGVVALLLMSGIFATQALAAAPLARIVVAKSGGNYATITAALNAITPTATNRYVIEVWPGVYTEPGIVNLKSYVHLKGSGRDVTILNNAVEATDKINVSVSGLTVTGSGNWIKYRNTTGTISENTVSNGRGIVISNSTTTSVPPYSVVITGNKSVNNFYDGIEITRVTAVVTNNVVSGNGNGGWSVGGIFVYYAGNSTISGNVITGNNGSGIHLFNDSTPTITNNVITDNVLVGLEYNYITSGGSATNNKIVNNGGATYTDIVINDRDTGTLVTPNISFNIFDDIGGNPQYSGSGYRGVGSYNVNSNGDPILVP